MASEKISVMPAAGALTGAEIVPIVQGGVNKRTTLDAIKAWLLSQLTAGQVPYFDGTDLKADNGLLRTGFSAYQVSNLTFSGGLQNGANNCRLLSTGDIFGVTVHAADGVTAAGPFANFTFNDGIVQAAS